MSLPSFARYPPTNLLKQLLPEELEACFDSWLLLIRQYLLLPQNIFVSKVRKDTSLTDFLVSYMREMSTSAYGQANYTEKGRELRSKAFLLAHRTLTDVANVPSQLLDVAFAEDLCVLYGKSTALKALLGKVWGAVDMEAVSPSFASRKMSLIEALDASRKKPAPKVDAMLLRTVAILKTSFYYAQFLMAGSDFIDALNTTYSHVAEDLQKKIVTTAYLCLISLLEPAKPRVSTLIDQMYGLKSNASGNSLLEALCSSTPFLSRVRSQLSGPDAARAQPLMAQLDVFENRLDGKLKKITKSKVDKGKAKSSEAFGHGALGNVHVHRSSQISQLQDLFPNLGTAFIIKLLDEYDDDPEQVTAHLLDDILPPHLKEADRTEDIPQMTHVETPEKTFDLAPRATPPPSPAPKAASTRRTIFDGDDFSRLAISPSQVHYGRKTDESKTADTLLAASASTSNKAAILSALAAFDSDDDERDDTYDVEDVGGTVDSALPGTSDDTMDAAALKQEAHEETLWQAWKMSPELFGRDAATRRSQARAGLRNDTGWTDEAIEGWATMLQREPQRLKRLEAKFSLASGAQQRGLQRTAWREQSPAGSRTATEDEEEADPDDRDREGGSASFRGRGRGRGRGGNRRGGGGDNAPGGGTTTEFLARRRKDASKSSRANHNRRDQRARKMARGAAGFAG
ncbi:MAG: hypothetical protein Q9191_000979 [Dirinaria sp. TL-2023a]